MKINIAYSPCPNDTYIFGGLANSLIDTSIDYQVNHLDIAELNALAKAGGADVVKVSFHAFCHLLDDYGMLSVGAALGFGVGPLLIANTPISDLNKLRSIVIPGQLTTANMLLRYAVNHDFETKVAVFDEIESMVLNQEVDAGVIIHENRFTYQDKGLVKLLDLGQYWEDATGYPIPLGGIAVKRTLHESVKNQIATDISQSIKMADEGSPIISTYIADNAQEMEQHVTQQHINLYVNQSTRGLKPIDIQSINHLINYVLGKDQSIDKNKWLFS